MRPKTYTCTGCRQTLEVGPPAEGDTSFVCPLPECLRPVWHRFNGTAESGRSQLVIGSDDVPDLSGAPYCVDRATLLLDGVPVLIGPPAAMQDFAAILNESRPDFLDLADVVRRLIQTSKHAGHYIPGCLLVRSGSMSLAQTWRKFDAHPDL